MSGVLDYYEILIDSLNLDVGNPKRIEQFDDRRFQFGVYLINPDSRAIKIRKGFIDELIIEDDILDWFHKGTMTFKNPDDIIERVSSQMASDTPRSDTVDIRSYRFRGDARDMLYIQMEPHLASDEHEVPEEKIGSMVHSMRFLFTIYAIEDITPSDVKKDKLQKVYFHDYRLQMLREKNLYYSTAKNIQQASGAHVDRQTHVNHLSDTDRAKNTGEIIQDLLGAALLTEDTKGLFSTHWEFGDNKMFYTSPAGHKAIDDINYVLDRHVSSGGNNNQPCILKLQRYTERWELLPITKYFSRALDDNKGPGPYQSEYFTLSFDSEADPNEIPPASKTFGGDRSSPMINYHFPDISVIDSYVFNEINGVDCQEILNSVAVHRYDESSKKFSVDLNEGNLLNVYNQFQSMFINHTFGGDGGHGYTSWLPDSTRNTNLNISVESSWTPDKTASLSVGRNKKLLAAFLLGNSIQFNSKGNTARRSGVWIAIDRSNNYIDSDYESKVLGQYFVTRVTHRITAQGYTNTILGIKPFMYDTPDERFNIIDIFGKDPEKITT
jgi:hypothetical protein